MNAKTVYSFHPRTGAYAGTDLAQESPLEPGTYLMPAHSTDVPPPAVLPGHVAAWDGAEWRVSERRAPAIAPSRSVSIARAAARIRLATFLDQMVEEAYTREAQLEQRLAEMPNEVAALDAFDPAEQWGS